MEVDSIKLMKIAGDPYIMKSPQEADACARVLNEEKPMEFSNKSIGEKFLKEAIQEANQQMLPYNLHLMYSYHEKAKRVIVKVIDSETEKVIREIPSERDLDAFINVLEMSGLLVDKKH